MKMVDSRLVNESVVVIGDGVRRNSGGRFHPNSEIWSFTSHFEDVGFPRDKRSREPSRLDDASVRRWSFFSDTIFSVAVLRRLQPGTAGLHFRRCGELRSFAFLCSRLYEIEVAFEGTSSSSSPRRRRKK